ncbi:MAG: Mut7-C RNAse domain-containing protein [Thermodesulfobacteriota bacterium]|nr:Mut7-C RNAse domain-containing protein [Thermodesulfobacteriota bacterium]
MIFAADRMLGKLAKWLRMLGYDTVYSNSLCDEKFLALADEGRVLLTRNTKLVGKVGEDRLVFVQANDPMAQLKEIIERLGLKPDPRRLFCRCTLCNCLLEAVDATKVLATVPEYVWTAHDRFSQCPCCGRVYWPGSHWERSRAKIASLLGC